MEGAPPLPARAAEALRTVLRIEELLSDPDQAAECDRLRDRFVSECGPGGTDVPCQLKKHRSATDFTILKGKLTAADRWNRDHGVVGGGPGTPDEDRRTAKRRYSYPMTS